MSGMYISGMASGIDTDALIKELTELQGQAVTRLENQKFQLQQKADAWRDIRTRLVNLQRSAADLTNSSLFNQKSIICSDPDVFDAAASSGVINGSYQLRVISLARAHRIAGLSALDVTGDEGAGARTSLGLEGVLTINDAVIEAEAGDSLLDIADKINGTGDSGVTAAVIDNHLVLTRTRTGLEGIKIDGESELGKKLGLVKGDGQLNTIQAGADAKFELNGLLITRASNLVNDVLEGITFNLLQETSGCVTITVRDDYSKLMEKVKDFIQQYNSTYQFVKSKIGADLDVGTKGILYGESSLHQMLSTIRRIVTGPVEGAGPYNTLVSLGINTVSWDSGESEGTLVLNEGKLIAALKENPEAVVELISGEKGAAGKLDSYLGNLTRYGEGLIDSRNKGIQDRMRDLDRRVDNLKRMLEKREQTLRNQFLSVERLLSQMNGQSQWLEQQFLAMQSWQGSSNRR